MTGLYYTRIDAGVSEERISEFRWNVTEETRRRVDRFHFRADGLRTLFGEVLLRHILFEYVGISDRVCIARGKYGKPYLVGREIPYNISHSGDLVVCVIGDHAVGVDVEEIRPIDISVARQFYDSAEYDYLCRLPATKRLDMFYRLWTLKEAYGKYLGIGLGELLNAHSFLPWQIESDIFRFDSPEKTLFFQRYDFPGHPCATCGEQVFNDEMVYVDLNAVTWTEGFY